MYQIGGPVAYWPQVYWPGWTNGVIGKVALRLWVRSRALTLWGRGA